MPKWAVAVGAGLLLLVLLVAAIWTTRAETEPTAASSPSPTRTLPSATPTSIPIPTPDPTPEIDLWAGGVCRATSGLVDSMLEVAGSLEYDPQDPTSIGEQFQQQIPGQLDGVEAAASDLGAALGGVPVDYIEAAAAVSVLQERIAVLTVAKDEALRHVDAARAADNPIGAGAEWLQAASAAKDTYDAGMQVKDALGPLVDSTDGDVREAFSRAPDCANVGWLTP